VFALLKYTGTQLQLGGAAPIPRLEDAHAQVQAQAQAQANNALPPSAHIQLPDSLPQSADVHMPDLEVLVALPDPLPIPLVPLPDLLPIPLVALPQTETPDARARLASITEEKEVDLISFDLL
jgi:hypothetical protein